jgi:sodium/bile acid cotransporter 7
MLPAFLKRNWFTLGILVMIALAFLAPGGSALNAGSRITNAVTVVLFLLIGLSLSSETILRDLRAARLHAFVLGFIFLANPLYFFLTTRVFAGAVEPAFLVGIYALACLPTTISSCIVFTQTSGGNTAAAVFNSAVSNILGVFLSPLLLSILIRQGGRGLPAAQLASILAGIGLRMLLPLAVGQLARIPLRAWASRRSGLLAAISNLLILLLIYLAAASAGSTSGLGAILTRMAPVFLYLAASAPLIVALAYGGARIVGLKRADVITAVFTGSQKTMAMGIPLITACLAGRPDVLGIAVLPIVFYHPWQLLMCAVARGMFLSTRLRTRRA